MYYCFILGKNSIIIIVTITEMEDIAMGFFKKIIGAAAVAGAAVGGALYVKNKKDENEGFEDFDDEKIFQVNTDNDNDGNKKVTITFNSRKAKDVADKAVDKVADATDKVKDIVTEKVGEENIEKVMDKVDEAKDKVMDAKDVIVEKVGEENIQMAKGKVKDVVNQAKDIVSDFVGKDDYEEVYTHDFNEDDFVDEDAVKEDVETEDDVDLGDSDDVLEDEVEDI